MANLTLVVPVFNESSRWSDRYWSELADLQMIRLVFVNDGSTDDSQRVLENFNKRRENCFLINLSNNVGKAEAIRTGLAWATKRDVDLVGFLDADGAFDLVEVKEIVLLAISSFSNALSPNSFWTSRVQLLGNNIQRRQSRHYIGRVIHTIIGFWIKDLPYDSQCGFKIFKSNEDLAHSISRTFRTRWFVDLEMLVRLRAINPKYEVKEIPLKNWFDVPNSKIGLKSVLTVLRDLWLLIRESKLIASKQ